MISRGAVTFKHTLKCLDRPGPHDNNKNFLLVTTLDGRNLTKSVPEYHNKFKENLFKICCPQKD